MNLFVALHAYSNGERTLPGIDAQLVDYPVEVLGRALLVTPRLALWMQPDRLRFEARDVAGGGLASVRVVRQVRGRFAPFLEVEAKTAGWVKGNEYLGRNVAVRTGLSVALR